MWQHWGFLKEFLLQESLGSKRLKNRYYLGIIQGSYVNGSKNHCVKNV